MKVSEHEELAAGEPGDEGEPGMTAHPVGREPARYVIRVAGELPPAPDVDLEGFRLTTVTTDGLTTAELVGEVPDQGALLRALRALHQQRLALLDLVCLSAFSAPGAPTEDRQ